MGFFTPILCFKTCIPYEQARKRSKILKTVPSRKDIRENCVSAQSLTVHTDTDSNNNRQKTKIQFEYCANIVCSLMLTMHYAATLSALLMTTRSLCQCKRRLHRQNVRVQSLTIRGHNNGYLCTPVANYDRLLNCKRITRQVKVVECAHIPITQ